MESALLSSSIGKYQLIASLGQGGMANVYLALVAGPAGFNKLLVIKILREDVMADAEEGVEMFLDEARLAARLVHSNIVHTYEVGEVAGRYYLAMEYLEGQSYRGLQARSRPGGIPIPDELRILSETARGLHYSHELKGYDGSPLGVVHRDVSPQNVFLTYDGQVKLLDFGIAKTSDAEHMTRVGVIKGKLDYIAPEQLRGDNVDRRADIFALGAMLWETMTGKRFGGGRKVGDATKAHIRLSGTERKIRDVQPDAPEALAAIVDKAIALHPDDRWEDAAAFADAIDAYLASTGHKPTAKSLSAFISPLFEVERAKISKTIEEQIELSRRSGAVRLGDKTAVLPRVRSDENLSGVWPAPDSMEHTVTGTPGPRSLAPLTGPPPPLSSVSTPKPARTGLVAGAAVAFLLLGGGSFFALAGPKNEASTSQVGTVAKGGPGAPAAAPGGGATTPSIPTGAPAALTPPGSGQVELAAVIQVDLKVFPEEATALLDGAPIPTHFSGEFRKDGTMHLLEVSGEGYRPLKQLISFDRDQSLQLSLERLPAPAPAASRRPRSNERNEKQAPAAEKRVEPSESPPPVAVAEPEPEPAPAESASPTPAPGGELKKAQKSRFARGLDSEDPYAAP